MTLRRATFRIFALLAATTMGATALTFFATVAFLTLSAFGVVMSPA